MSDPDLGRPADLRLSLAWHAGPSGSLAGRLQARNVSDRLLRLAGKPALKPLGTDGLALDVDCVVTAEMRRPGFVDMAVGEAAVAPVVWGGWAGVPASGDWEVTLPGGTWFVTATGPRQPASLGLATNVSSTWWAMGELDSSTG